MFNFPIIAGPGHRSPHNCNRFILLTLNSFLRPMRPGASRICIQAPSSSPVSLSPRVSVSHTRVQCSLLHPPGPCHWMIDPGSLMFVFTVWLSLTAAASRLTQPYYQSFSPLLLAGDQGPRYCLQPGPRPQTWASRRAEWLSLWELTLQTLHIHINCLLLNIPRITPIHFSHSLNSVLMEPSARHL